MMATATTALGYTTHAGKILDDKGNTVQLRGVNWFGFGTQNSLVGHGLWTRNWKEMITQMQGAGFNAVRLPFCPRTLTGVMPQSIDYYLNPDLRELTSLQIMDKVIAEMSNRGMYILLDHHTTDCENISELWYTPTYSEAQWINDLRFVAQRYANVPGVIGIDIKNEPHGAATWGTGNVATDWNLAAERASAAVLQLAPKWLIGVEGIGASATCSGTEGQFWGGNLGPLACTPLNIPGHKLLLVPHSYGPDVYVQSYFNASNFPANMPAIWDKQFGKFAQAGYTVMLGEFGGKYGEGDARDVQWQNAMVNYLISKNIRSGFYWSWNPNSTDTGGILKDDWKTLRTDKVQLMQKLWGNSGNTTPPPPPQPAPNFGTMQTLNSDWGSGYCNNVKVTNFGNASGNWTVSFAIKGRMYKNWNSISSQSGGTLKSSGVSWNKTLAPGQSAEFGYCASR